MSDQNKAIGNIVQEMRTNKNGMNTKDIMQALCMASTLSMVSGKASNLNMAIATDGVTAKLLNDLETKVETSLRQLDGLVDTTKINIENLRSVKTSAAIADNYQSKLLLLESDVKNFRATHKEQIQNTRLFITKMQQAFRELGNDPNNNTLKDKVRALYAEIQQKSDETRKSLMGENIRTLTKEMRTLHNAVTQATVTATGKAAQPTQLPGLN